MAGVKGKSGRAKQKETMNSVYVRLDDAVLVECKALARENEWSISSCIRKLVKEALAHRETKTA